ncbi:MAG: hypothetical protein JJ863_28345 [Deltaproteobacteria bacterium]|nr:hypothetical protein [Deltaproteobacteria bacterium]
MRARLATLVAFGLGWVPWHSLARAQEEADSTVRPDTWPEAGRWPVPAWAVVLVGAVLVALVVVGLARAIRRRGRR